jgi:hypothetical protein
MGEVVLALALGNAAHVFNKAILALREAIAAQALPSGRKPAA